jgi:hypothetical protein
MAAEFEAWRYAKLQEYPWFYRDYIQLYRRFRGSRLPLFLLVGGDLARVALRFKAPCLRLHQRNQQRALCAWCHIAPECGRHLLHCPRIPPPLLHTLDRARYQVQAEAALDVDPYWHQVNFSILSMHWRNCQATTIRSVLIALARLLAAYRSATPRDPVTGYHHIWPVPIPI